MKLAVTRQKAGQQLAGSQAVVLKDDINGSSLAIHTGDTITFVTLASIVAAIAEQDAEGSKGDGVNE